MDHGWLVNPKRRKRARRSRRRMPAALARYWRTHRRRGRRVVAARPRRRIHHRKRRAVTKGYGASWLPAHYSNPSLIKEVAMFGMNPRRRRRHHRRSHYRHNPRRRGRGLGRVGVMSMIQNPMDTISQGLFGSVGVFLPIATANWLLPFPGPDIMSRLLRFASRAAAAGLIVQFGGGFAGRYAQALKVGAYIGVAGSTVLDFLGTAVLIGRGDATQVPQQLLAGFMAPAPVVGTAGLGAAYTRRLGVGAAYTRARGLSGLHGQGAIGTGFRHGLLGGL